MRNGAACDGMCNESTILWPGLDHSEYQIAGLGDTWHFETGKTKGSLNSGKSIPNSWKFRAHSHFI